MKRRELLLKGIGGLSLAVFAPQVSSAAGSGPEPCAPAEFYDLWEEGCLAHFWCEDRRAYDLLQQALRLAPADLDTGLLADIYEKLNWIRESLAAAEREVIAQYAAVKADPDDADKHFYLAFTLGRLGRQEEALAEYQAALRNPERLCAHCFRDSWNNIGWYYYRQGQYREALKWFERVCNLNDTAELLQNLDKARAVENKLLAYSALGMVAEAETTTRGYLARYGRVPWPERRALASIGINADAMYVERCNPTV